MMTVTSCLDTQGQLIIFEQNVDFNSVPKFRFEPYKAYTFKLNVTKPLKQKVLDIIIVV